MHIPPDWGIFGVLIASFLIFWAIFGWLFFDPFLKLLGERERRLREVRDRTEQLLREEKAAVQERDAQLAAVRREALSRRENERRRAEREAAEMIEQARTQARGQLDQVRAGIEKDIEAATQQLQQLAHSLAAELAGRVLGRPVSNGRAIVNN